ncbi:hypothetical protein CCP2SC5_600010 [Azospirillaceae bacterium]
MNIVTFDLLKFVRVLKSDNTITPEQAEYVATILAYAMSGAEPATRNDIKEISAELKNNINDGYEKLKDFYIAETHSDAIRIIDQLNDMSEKIKMNNFLVLELLTRRNAALHEKVKLCSIENKNNVTKYEDTPKSNHCITEENRSSENVFGEKEEERFKEFEEEFQKILDRHINHDVKSVAAGEKSILEAISRYVIDNMSIMLSCNIKEQEHLNNKRDLLERTKNVFKDIVVEAMECVEEFIVDEKKT